MSKKSGYANVAFWNLKDRYSPKIGEVLSYLSKRVDILFLAEADDESLLNNILPSGYRPIDPIPPFAAENCLRGFYLPSAEFEIEFDKQVNQNRIQFYTLRVPEKQDLTLTAVHLKSKYKTDDATQYEINRHAIGHIIDYEKNRTKHYRNILLGDFNHNPYEKFFLNTTGLNAVSSKKVVTDIKHRSINYKRIPLRYNPMWRFLGDYQNGGAAVNYTYFLPVSKSDKTQDNHVNILDQVVINKDALELVEDDSIRIISAFDHGKVTKSILSENYEGRESSYVSDDYSDHLPITFTINLKKFK